MANSVLVFVSHSSADKAEFVEPIVSDLEDCYINVWLDKKKIVPGENLRHSIFREGLDKADVVLIVFTAQSLDSPWVDQEIKHVLREQLDKGNDFDLRKVISIFDSADTYEVIRERYPELTDDLLHLMPVDYSPIQLGQLISAIWSKYLSLQGGDIATQRKLLEKDREIFQKEQDIQALQSRLENLEKSDPSRGENEQFKIFVESGKLSRFIQAKNVVLTSGGMDPAEIGDSAAAKAFGLLNQSGWQVELNEKGRRFFEWLMLQELAP